MLTNDQGGFVESKCRLKAVQQPQNYCQDAGRMDTRQSDSGSSGLGFKAAGLPVTQDRTDRNRANVTDPPSKDST